MLRLGRRGVLCCLLLGGLAAAVEPQGTAGEVPPERRAAYDEAMRWLNELIERCQPDQARRVVLSGQCLAVEARPHHPEADALYVDMLCEAGVDAIDVYPWPALWKRDPQRYDRLIKHIRRKGKKVILGYQVLPRRYRAGSVEFRFQPYFKRPPSFDEFLALERELTEIYINRYRPQLYWVVVEPATNEGRLGVRYSRSQWRRLVQEICRLVKRLRPQTQTGATAVHIRQLEPFADVPELDVLGCDLYARRDLGEIDKLVALANRHGKKRGWAKRGSVMPGRPGSINPGVLRSMRSGFKPPTRSPNRAVWKVSTSGSPPTSSPTSPPPTRPTTSVGSSKACATALGPRRSTLSDRFAALLHDPAAAFEVPMRDDEHRFGDA